MSKANCWEVMDCGRQPGGAEAEEHGVCPAAIETQLDGINAGDNGGRACWVAAGVLSHARIEATFALDSLCESCSFYQRVIEEEGSAFVFSPKMIATPGRVEPRWCTRGRAIGAN